MIYKYFISVLLSESAIISNTTFIFLIYSIYWLLCDTNSSAFVLSTMKSDFNLKIPFDRNFKNDAVID